MDQDGVREGYDVEQLAAVRELCPVPLIASGGAGAREHFRDVFTGADVDGALAASVFHKQVLGIGGLKLGSLAKVWRCVRDQGQRHRL
jgi:cyclase